LEQSIDALSNADGEYEFVLPPEHFLMFLYKESYEKTISFLDIAAESRQSNITVLKEGMFVVYESVAKGNVLALKHGISKEQRSFSERYEITIWEALFYMIIGGISGFFVVRSLNKRKQKHSQE
jgi:hypothetical protein